MRDATALAKVRLSEVADLNPENLANNTSGDYSFIYVDLTSARQGVIDWSLSQQMTFRTAPSRARRRARLGDCIFGTVRPAQQSHGSIDRDSGDVVVSTGFTVLRAHRSRLDPRFLRHWLLSDGLLRQAESKAVGSNYPAVNEADVGQFTLMLLPLAEQQRIVQVLDTLDDQIETIEQIIRKESALRAGLIDDLIGATPGIRTSLTEVASRAGGSTTIGPFGSNLVADDYRSSGIPVVFVRDIREDGFFWVSDVYVDRTKARELRAHGVRGGDLLLTKMGFPPCIAAVYPTSMPEGIITADIIRIRPDPSRVDSHWLGYAINHEKFRRQVRAITGGVTRPKVTLRDVRNLSVELPSVGEQRRIGTCIKAISDRLRSAVLARESLLRLRQGLMDDLLTGRVRVPVGDAHRG